MMIRPALAGLLLSLSALPAARGAGVAVCDPTSAAQAWRLREPAAWGQPASLVNTAAGGGAKCLDVADRDKAPGTHVRSWNCCCAGLVDANGTSVCGDPESGKAPCGNTRANYNQVWELNTAGHLTTGKVMGELCLEASPTALVTATCTAASTKWVYVASESPSLRLLSNRSMCLSAPYGGRPPPSPPHPSGPVAPVPQACTSANTTTLPFCDPKLSTAQRVTDLLQRLTTDEKLTQMIGANSPSFAAALPASVSEHSTRSTP